MTGKRKFHLEDYEQSILEHIAEGGNLRVWCRGDGRPSWRLVYKWKDENEAFRARLARARDMGFDAMAHDLRELVEEPVPMIVTTTTSKSGESVREQRDGVEVQRRRLEVDAKLKLLACWSNKYSDRVRVGGDADAPPLMSSEERDVRIRQLVGEALANREKGVRFGDEDTKA